MRVALYHRVSTVDQDAELASAELHRAVLARGWVIALEIAETGSGARNDRPGLQRIMEEARRGRIDAVMVWKLDRFGRSALDLLSNLRELERVGVRFVATTQGIDLSPDGDAMSRFMMTVLAGVAEFERTLIIERTRLGIDRARRRGTHLGRPRAAHAPSYVAVRELREGSRLLSWARLASELGCTIAAARRAYARAEIGVVAEPASFDEKLVSP